MRDGPEEGNSSGWLGGPFATQETRVDRLSRVSDAREIKTILLAVSTVPPSNAVLELVSDLGRRLDADVVAFHVREWLFGPGGAFDEGRRAATRLLDRVINRLRSEGARARGVTGGGRPGQIGHAIVDAANAERADLIVLGFQRHSLLDEVLTGGVVREVRDLSNVPCGARKLRSVMLPPHGTRG